MMNNNVPKAAKLVWLGAGQSLWRLGSKYWLRSDIDAPTGRQMALPEAAEYLYLEYGYVSRPRRYWDTAGIPSEILEQMYHMDGRAE